MPLFRYNATSPDGQPIAGEVEADNLQAAIEQIVAHGLKIQLVEEVAPPNDVHVPLATVEEGLLRQQLDRLVRTRSLVAPALEAYALELPAGGERTEVRAMAQQLRAGKTAADLYDHLTPQWARLACASVRSVDPSYLIRALTQRHDLAVETRQTLIRVLSYPAMILLASFIAYGVFAYCIAPVFVDLFESFGAELPWITSVALRSTQRITALGWYWYVLAGLLGAVLLRWFSSSRGRGRTNRFAAISTLTESLADVIDGRASVPEAIRMAVHTVVAPPLRESAEVLATDIEQHRVPAQVAGIPQSLVYALTCTNESSAMASLLRELAIIYRMAYARRTRWLLAFLEPLAIVVVGLITGFVFVAILSPLFSLVTNLS